MTNKSITAMMYDINNRDADGGGLWLPNIQRQFVWQEDQIEAWSRLEDGNAAVYKATRLFDSNGKGIDEAPDGSGNEPNNNISVIKKVGGPHTY